MDNKPQRLILDISWSTLFKVMALLVAVFAVILLQDILIMLAVVFIFVAAVNPTIAYMQRYMSRPLAVILFYIMLLMILASIVYFFTPILIHQVNELIQQFPAISDRLRSFYDSYGLAQSSIVQQAVDSFSGSVQSITQNVFNTTLTFFGGVAAVLTGLVLSFYLLMEEKNARDFFYQIMPRNRFEPMYHTVRKISDRMGSWIRAQILIMFIIGLANFIVLVALGIPSPLPLAIWAGLCEAIPYFGPILGALPAVAVGLSSGGLIKGLLVFVLAFGLVQQLEGQFLIPKLMSKILGLSPVLVIIALLIGLKILGVLGAIVAIPTAAVISVIIGEWPSLKSMWETSEEQ